MAQIGTQGVWGSMPIDADFIGFLSALADFCTA